MSFSIHTSAQPAIHQMFNTLESLAGKAQEAAKAREVEESVFLNWRLAPDMFPLLGQFQLATEIPARGLSRLADAPLPSFADDESSFEEVIARIGNARTHIAELSIDALNADPTSNITVPMGPQEMTMPRQAYVQGFVLPNLYFHASAAYLILRHLGLDIGKRDFLAAT